MRASFTRILLPAFANIRHHAACERGGFLLRPRTDLLYTPFKFLTPYRHFTMAKDPIRVLITGAAGQIGYSLIYMVCSGRVFGYDQPMILHLLDIPPMMKVLGGVCMEITDCAFKLVREVVPTDDVAVAFKDIHAAFLVGSMPRRQGMERKDLLGSNVKIFKTQGAALDQYARKDALVLVVGNPANTNALMCAKFAPSIPKENITAMSRLDFNRLQAQVALKCGVPAKDVSRCIIWGNHSVTMVPDISQALIAQKDGAVAKAKEIINSDDWVQETLVPTVQKRGAEVIAARGLSSAMSAANAASDHMRDWWQGTNGRWVAMSVYSDGSNGIPEGVMFSVPVKCEPKKWIRISDAVPCCKSGIDKTSRELLEERQMALDACNE